MTPNKQENKYIKILIMMDQDEIVDYVASAVDNNDKEKCDIIKAALYLDMDPNHIYSGIPILHHIVRTNDIVSCAHLVKNGADIHKKSQNNLTVLHMCAFEGHKQLLKFFVEKGVDVDCLDYDGNTALIVAGHNSRVECVKYLLLTHADVTIKNSLGFTILTMIIEKLTSSERQERLNSTNYLSILKTILDKKQKLKSSEILELKDLISFDRLDAIKIVVDKFPNCFNVSFDKQKNTLFLWAVKLNKKEIVTYFLTFKNLELVKTNRSKISCLHLLATNLDVENIKTVLSRCPKLTTMLCEKNRTAVEYALSPGSVHENNENNEENIIATVKTLVDAGVDINSRNSQGCRALECAIQYHSAKLVDEIITLGANITEKRVKKISYPAINNNDPLAFGAHVGKLDVVKLLIKRKAITHMHDTMKIKYRIPTVLIVATVYQREDILKYLLSLKKFKVLLNDQVKKYLLDIALENGCVAHNILQNFASEEYISKLKLNPRIMRDRYYEQFIRRHLENYEEHKKSVLRNMFLLLSVLNEVFVFKQIKQLHEIFFRLDKLYYNVAPNVDKIEILISIICNVIDHFNQTDIRFCIYSIRETQEAVEYGNMTLENAKTEISKLKNILSCAEINKLKDFLVSTDSVISGMYNICKCCARDCSSDDDSNSNSSNSSSCDVWQSSESSQSDNDSQDSQDSDSQEEKAEAKAEAKDIPDMIVDVEHIKYVKKVLFKLAWPEKQPHYDMMYNLLTNMTETCKQTDNEIVIFDSNNKKISKVNTLFRFRKPSRWFKFYGSHIMLKKKDHNHAFPFILDTKLHDWPCFEKQVADTTNPEGSDTLLYFYGEFNGVVGCFEYFINSFGTLFHRMFRPYESLQVNIKRLLPRQPGIPKFSKYYKRQRDIEN